MHLSYIPQYAHFCSEYCIVGYGKGSRGKMAQLRKIDPTLKICNRLSWFLAGILRLWQYMYSITKCKHIWVHSWNIWKIKKYGIRPFCPDPGAKRHTLCHFAPNGMFHCINVVQAVLWLIRLTNFWLAQIITPVNNNDSTKSKHS